MEIKAEITLEHRTLELFEIIRSGLATIQNINNSWIEIPIKDKKIIHFTKLTDLSVEEKCIFTDTIVDMFNDINTNVFTGVQIRQQGSRSAFGRSFEVTFKDDKQKQDFLRYKYVLTGINCC
jgi:hypothetical protein